MIRQALMKRGEKEVVNGFRMRGTEVSRLEAFTDAVFALAVTLLAVSIGDLKDYSMLLSAMRALLPFAACFGLLFMIWNQHYLFSRRYGLEDGPVRAITACLLFTILAYVFPLKFLFSIFLLGVFGIADSRVAPTIEAAQVPGLFVIYGIGYAAVFFMFYLLYRHAYRHREALELNELEVHDTKWAMVESVAAMTVPLLSIVLALTLPGALVGIAGYAYFLAGVVGGTVGTMNGKTRRKVERSVAKAAPIELPTAGEAGVSSTARP